MLYNDAVEEALCFGSIDSINQKLDDQHTMPRFMPRRKNSIYSQANKERLKWLLENQMIHPTYLDEVKQILECPFVFPDDIILKIRMEAAAWKNFSEFSDAYKRIRIAYIERARNRPEEFLKRLNHFIEKTRSIKQIKGFGGIEKYY